MKPEWYAPKSIHYTKPQVLWLLLHLEYLMNGYWPSEHTETGYEYIGNPGARGIKRAYFETPVGIGAELSARLEACKEDGMMLEFMVASRYDDVIWLEARLAKYHSTTRDDVDRRIRLALNYCCGNNRKRVSYHDYKIQQDSYERKKSRR